MKYLIILWLLSACSTQPTCEQQVVPRQVPNNEGVNCLSCTPSKHHSAIGYRKPNVFHRAIATCVK